MYSIILAASISAVVAVAIYAVVTNLVIKTSIRKRREAAVKEAEAEGEMIKKERILQAKEKFIQLKSEYDRQVNERNQKIAQSEQRAKQIEQNLQNSLEREVSTEAIGEQVMDKLRSVDEVAYVRFASVYRQFKDIDTFMHELNKLLADKT